MMWEVRQRLKVLVHMMVMIVMVSVAAASTRMFGGGELTESNGKEAVLELTIETFNTTLWASPAPAVIVEFYAHWCPACQNFKPKYEQVAQLFNGPDAAYPGVLLMAKVDCAAEINRNLCHRFSVKRYPTMLWGEPSTFAWGSRLEENDQTFEQMEGARVNAQHLMDWINSHLEKSYSLDPAIEKKQPRQVTDSVSGHNIVPIHDIEEATAQAYAIILDEKLVSPSQRAPFVQFLQLLTAHHPSRRCRVGSAQILFNLVDAWPNEHIVEAADHGTVGASQTRSNLADIVALRQFRICGEDLPSKTYKTCDMAAGGYSCGLWYLFHALSVRVDDSESNSAMKAISNFVTSFFPCEECRQHFLEMSQSISTRRGLTLWFWRAHNKVNHRLGKEVEASLDPERPKIQWPRKVTCPACRMGSEDAHGSADEEIKWDEEEVYKFLRKTYGQSILTVTDEAQTLGGRGYGKDENLTSSAITAPVGAAVGIAMASCGFGVAACCWRLQQKKRKHMRKRGSNFSFDMRDRHMRKRGI